MQAHCETPVRAEIVLFLPMLSLLCLVLGLGSSGCVVATGSFNLGEPLDPEKMESIRPGTTRQSEILEWFGPPTALLRPGKSVELGPPRAETLDYDNAFLLFAEHHEPGPEMAVYYYRHLSTSRAGAFVVAVVSASMTIERERLWILIDEHTRRVVDYVFRED
jgi:hypothetical protein